MSWFHFSRHAGGRPARKSRKRSLRRDRRRNFLRGAAGFETLENRIALAVTAAFAPGTGTLTVFGDAAANTIEISRNAAGNLLVNGGAVNIRGGTPTVANTALIQVFGLGESHAITLNQANGALPRANLFGGAGIDTLTGGSG